MRAIILDSETTGISTKSGHRIIELAALEVIDGNLTGKKLHMYFNPQRDIEAGATAVHGITNEQLKDAHLFADEADTIIDFISGAVAVAHNSKFDIEFLDSELVKAGKHESSSYIDGVIDTLLIAKAKFPKQKNSLDALCERFHIDKTSRSFHGALIDCELLFSVWENLKACKEEVKIEFERFESISGELVYWAMPIEASEHNRIMEGLS